MKNLIYLFAVLVLFTACENEVLEPNYSENPAVEKNIANNDFLSPMKPGPKKNYEVSVVKSIYRFDPYSPDDKVGGFIDRNSANYSYEHANERTIRNLQVYSPSRLVVGDKSYETFNVYTINKRELLSEKGAVLEGTAWGKFKIQLAKEDIIFDEEGIIKYDLSTESPLKDLGEVLLSGEFKGKISGKKAVLTLSGRGSNILEGGTLSANEVMNCAGDFCWRSKITGKIKKVVFKDE